MKPILIRPADIAIPMLLATLALPAALAGAAVVALEAASGREIWRAANPLDQGVIQYPSLIFAEGMLILGHKDRTARAPQPDPEARGGRTLDRLLTPCIIGAFDAKTGKRLWQNNTAAQPLFGAKPVDLFVNDGNRNDLMTAAETLATVPKLLAEAKASDGKAR